jgi:hypothetical protein
VTDLRQQIGRNKLALKVDIDDKALIMEVPQQKNIENESA